jgi:acyl carrier protein
LTDQATGLQLAQLLQTNYPNNGGTSMSETLAEVKAIIVELLGGDESKITPQARFREDLEADSLDLVELIMAFEDKFGAEISDEEAQKIKTVGDVIDYIDAHKK